MRESNVQLPLFHPPLSFRQTVPLCLQPDSHENMRKRTRRDPLHCGCGKVRPHFSSPFITSALTLTLLPRLPRFVHAPSRCRPLFSTCTGGYSFLVRLKWGCALQTVFAQRTLSFLLRSSALRAPSPPLFSHVPPALVRVCAVRHALRTGGKQLCANRDVVGGDCMHHCHGAPIPLPPFPCAQFALPCLCPCL